MYFSKSCDKLYAVIVQSKKEIKLKQYLNFGIHQKIISQRVDDMPKIIFFCFDVFECLKHLYSELE